MQPSDLSGLVGHFHGTDRTHESAWTEEAETIVTVVATAELDGGLVVQRHEQSPGPGRVSALNVFMTDPESGDVLLYAFDSLGYPPDPPARGGWQDGELVLVRETTRGQSRTTYRPGPEGYGWRKEFRPSARDAWQTVVSGLLTHQDVT